MNFYTCLAGLLLLGAPAYASLGQSHRRTIGNTVPYSDDETLSEDQSSDMNGRGYITLTVNSNSDNLTDTRFSSLEDIYDLLKLNKYLNSLGSQDDKRANHKTRTMDLFQRVWTVAKRRYEEADEEEGGVKTPISRYMMRRFPYSNIVQLSSGCTGTLLTPYHVLTAAHCVHDGEHFKEHVEMMKVHVPDKYGYRAHYVARINVPLMWTLSRVLPSYAYDYAVLQLNLPVSGKERFMQLALPTTRTKLSDLHFFGFFQDEETALWKSTCPADRTRYVLGGQAVLTRCESAVGNSGAAVFAGGGGEEERIIGVLSSSLTNSRDTAYEAVMLLTLAKCLDICAMIYPEGEKYDVCVQVRRTEGQYLRVGANRIMPYFG